MRISPTLAERVALRQDLGRGASFDARPHGPRDDGSRRRRQTEGALRGRRKSAEDVCHLRARSPRRARTARRARHVPDRNRAARRRGAARRLDLRKGRHAHEYRGRSAVDASLDRPAGPAQRFRSASHSFAPTRHARARLADSAAHRRSGVRRNSPERRRATIFRTRICSRAARKLPPPAAGTSNRPTSRPPARSFLPTIICLPAAHWAVTVPSSLRPTRQKRGRGVHHPAPSPGGIASQDCRPAVRRDDGLGVPDLVRAQSRRAHPVALGPVLRGRARIAAAAGRRPEVPFQGGHDAAGFRQVRLHPRAVSRAGARAHGHRADSLRPADRSGARPAGVHRSRTWISACCFSSPSRPSASTAWRWPDGLRTANIRCSAGCAARRR